MRGSTTLKFRIKRWAEESGRWDEFVRARETLKKGGMSPSEAWLAAAAQLEPSMWGEVSVVKPAEKVSPVADLPHGRSEESKAPEVEEVEDKLPLSGSQATKETFGGKRVPTAKVVEWVASNLQVADAMPEDAPSSEAWGMLVWARRSPVNESQFWGSIYAKLLPSRSQLEAEQRYSEDGTRIEEMAERLMAIRERVEVR